MMTSTQTFAQHTRVPLAADRHLTVDWSITGYALETGRWTICARAVLWRTVSLASRVSLAVQPLSRPVGIELDGEQLEHLLRQLMVTAHELCLAAHEAEPQS